MHGNMNVKIVKLTGKQPGDAGFAEFKSVSWTRDGGTAPSHLPTTCTRTVPPCDDSRFQYNWIVFLTPPTGSLIFWKDILTFSNQVSNMIVYLLFSDFLYT